MPDPIGFFSSAAHQRRLGLAVFLNAGDPPLSVLPELAAALDDLRVDCLELAVPFPDSCTDGPTIRRSAARALSAGVDLAATLEAVGAVRPLLRHLKITLLADWSHTVRSAGVLPFMRTVADGRGAGRGVDAVLLHGLPPLLRQSYLDAAAEHSVPVVTSCYQASSTPQQVAAADAATAYVYLVAGYGRTGAPNQAGYHLLGPTVTALRSHTTQPIAVGFGVRSAEDLDAIRRAGADAAVVGSAAVATVESALEQRRDVVADLVHFVTALRATELSIR